MITAGVHTKKIDSVVLSEYILKHYGPMSHLKLQKLLFYCDAYHLARFGVELVEDKFEAWVHGPVSRRVYDALKQHSKLHDDVTYTPSENSSNVDSIFSELASEQQEWLSIILEDLSQWTGIQLEIATHSERPWQVARVGYHPSDKCSQLISKKETKSFYSEELNSGIYGQEETPKWL